MIIWQMLLKIIQVLLGLAHSQMIVRLAVIERNRVLNRISIREFQI